MDKPYVRQPTVGPLSSRGASARLESEKVGRPRPERLRRLPQQYFVALLGRVAAAAAEDGPPLVDLGRGNPEIGPPPHVVEALAESARRPDVHGYAPIRGLAAHAGGDRRRATATSTASSSTPSARSRSCPARRPAIVELALSLADEGETMLLPDPYYPDYPSGAALAGARSETVPLDPDAGWAPDLDAAPEAAALYLNYPSNPCAVCAPDGVFDDAVRWAERTGGAVVHDAAYIDLVFDGRAPQSFLATPGAKDVGVEMWSMSKTYGMAGWRIGFVVGNAEIVERINLLNDHSRVGHLRADAARDDRRARRAAGLRRRARRRLRAPARRDRRGAARADRLRGNVLRLASAAGGAHRRRGCSRSTASPSRPARASGRAAPAGRGSRSPCPTRRSRSAPSGSREAFAGVAA